MAEKYMVEGGETELGAWISHYCKEDDQIMTTVNLFQINEDLLFLKSPP